MKKKSSRAIFIMGKKKKNTITGNSVICSVSTFYDSGSQKHAITN